MSQVPSPPTQRRMGRVALLGPAFVAAVAYVDPGNVATNLTAGARYGYLLVWVVVSANIMAALVQYLSAKLGLATGRSLPDLLGQRLRKPVRVAFWAQAEIVAMATDVAEVVGGAIALNLLFDIPLVLGGLTTAVVSLILLAIRDSRGQKAFERLIMAFLGVIAAGFLFGLFLELPAWGDAARGLIPHFAGTDSVLVAAGVLGATVMPHAIYLHSALTRDRFAGSTPLAVDHTVKAARWDIGIAMGVAGAVNLGMLLLAATSLAGKGAQTETIEGAYGAIQSALGPAAAVLFGVGLLASGLASTSVGAYAGAAIMQGLLHRSIPMVVRRGITVIPALVVLGVGSEPTWLLVISQVVLSFGIPFALIPLVRYTSLRSVMGTHANARATTLLASAVALLIVALNVALIVLTIAG